MFNFFYHLHTTWLFTVSDLKSVVIPETILGLTAALSGSLLTDNDNPQSWEIFLRTPQVVLWTWLNLFLFDLCNQSQTQSVLEDCINKPWRAIPSHRISATQARTLLLLVIPTVYLSTLRLGGTWESVTLMIGTWMYNDLGGADNGVIVRNLLNALGYICYSSGSMKVATGFGQHDLNETSTIWLEIIGGIIFTTLQMQDMADVHGDAKRGRKTVPLIYGDRFARWSIAIPVVAWSLVCPAFWVVGLLGYVLPIIAAGVFLSRLFMYRSVEDDALTWWFWCAWLSAVFITPLAKRYGI
ncbi:MAG: hypothetical protein L6R41_005299 [Letrouitia leprolyta]|nr:MAG: hypothetical protein L6R41_005299 [Letrouitia leprolyta]